MNRMGTADIKRVSLDILMEVDRFCRRNSIRYSLAGGTALGAVRHGGFIPWDDDIDIIIPQPDYEQFCIEWNDTENYKLYSYNRNNTRIPYARVCEMNRTKVTSPALWNKDRHSGIWIDIFPVDGVSDKFKSFSEQVDRSRVLIAEILRQRFKDTRVRHFTFQKSWFRLALYKMFKLGGENNNLLRMHSELRHEVEYGTTAHVGMLAITNYGNREYFDINIFESYTEILFENHKFMIIKDWNTYLGNLYGDYMKLPPIEKRVQAHSDHKYMWK